MGIGVDIVRVERFSDWVNDKKKLLRFFHPNEIDYCLSVKNSAECFAARFAAREALMKAYGLSIGKFFPKDIWVGREDSGKPFFQFSDTGRENFSNVEIHLSISHEKDYAIAFVHIVYTEK